MLEKNCLLLTCLSHCPKSMRRWDMQMLCPTKRWKKKSVGYWNGWRQLLLPVLFFISGGELDESKDSLSVGDTCFSIGKIITRQLRGSESFAFFAATAGTGFERFQHTLQQEGDMVKVYIADAIGSVIAEKTADCMEIALDEYIRDRGWRHTNRFSPGYCGWHVSEQKKLFPLFPSAEPCGIRLTDSSLMLPIKSVSGVIGLGDGVRKLEYTCGLCTYDKCYRRKRRG